MILMKNKLKLIVRKKPFFEEAVLKIVNFLKGVRHLIMHFLGSNFDNIFFEATILRNKF